MGVSNSLPEKGITAVEAKAIETAVREKVARADGTRFVHGLARLYPDKEQELVVIFAGLSWTRLLTETWNAGIIL